MIELVDKDIKITIVNMFHMFKKIEESMRIWDLNQSESLEVKIQYWKWKNTVKNRLDTEEEMIGEFEDMVIEII